MTAIEIVRAVLNQHLGDISRRGHMPNCTGGFWIGDGPRECTALCREAQRILEKGETMQLELMPAGHQR